MIQKFGVTARIVTVCEDDPGACFFAGEVFFVGEVHGCLRLLLGV